MDSRLERHRSDSEDYASSAARIEQRTADLEQARIRSQELSHRLDRAARLERAWEDLGRIAHIQRRREELPDYGTFPESPISRLDDARERLEEAERARAEAQQHVDSVTEALEEPSARGVVLEDAQTISRTIQERQRLEKALDDLPEREAEVGTAERVVDERLKALGPQWGAESLQQVDTSVVVGNAIDTFERQLWDEESAVRSSRQAVQTAAEREQEASARCWTAPVELARYVLPGSRRTCQGIVQRTCPSATRHQLHQYFQHQYPAPSVGRQCSRGVTQ